MKNIKFILTILLLTKGILVSYSQNCENNLTLVNEALNKVPNTTYLKDFYARLDAVQPGKEIPKAKFSMVLTEGSYYQFSFANSKELPGKLIFELYNNKQLIGTNYQKKADRFHPYFGFKCHESGVYHMHLYFKDGEAGCGVGVLSFVRKLDDPKE